MSAPRNILAGCGSHFPQDFLKTPGNRTLLAEVTFLPQEPGSSQAGDTKDLWNLNFFGALLNAAEQEFLLAPRFSQLGCAI